MKLYVFAPSFITAGLFALTSLVPGLGQVDESAQLAAKHVPVPAAYVAVDAPEPAAKPAPAPQKPVLAAMPNLEDEIPAHYFHDARTVPEDLGVELAGFAGVERQDVTVRKGDTLLGLLTKQGTIDYSTANKVVDALETAYDPRQLRRGNNVTLLYEKNYFGRRFMGLDIEPSLLKSVSVRMDPDIGFSAHAFEKQIVSEQRAFRGTIRTSLFDAGARANVPVAILSRFVRAMSWHMDMQRDIQPGDQFEILYDVGVDDTGEVVKVGNMLYAAITARGEKTQIYRYENEDGFDDYYLPNGRSIRTSLLRTPVESARVSSNFGMRRHPILGYSKMHKGIDFAAPRGTPIYAAGDGVVERIGRWGAYGHYIRLRHSNGIKTAYAHLHRYARGLGRGDKVRQGDIIGYVGSTGRSTGPHLHYEVLIDGKAVDPKSVDLPTGNTLSGPLLAAFHEEVSTRDALFFDLLSRKVQLAGNFNAAQNQN